MDEDVIHMLAMADADSLRHCMSAYFVAEMLEDFVDCYPDRELRREGKKLANRLYNISATGK